MGIWSTGQGDGQCGGQDEHNESGKVVGQLTMGNDQCWWRPLVGDIVTRAVAIVLARVWTGL
jgi:hypothetical protein